MNNRSSTGDRFKSVPFKAVPFKAKSVPFRTGIFLCWLVSAGVCAEEYVNPVDPWEGWNRSVFAFNEAADKWVFKPVARGYKRVTPVFLDKGLTNVFSNLGEILTVVNDLLQFKFGEAGTGSGRFLINTTAGVAGFFDVAQKMGLESGNEDFGQSFACWGVDSGPYLVLPFFGPRTVRDAISLVPDGLLNPVRYIDHVPTRNTVYTVDLLDLRADLLDAEELIQGDKYIFLRDAYLQRRESLIKDGAIEDDFGDEDF